MKQSGKTNSTNIFELCWSWYEDNESWLFTHDNKTTKQFQSDVRSLLKSQGKEYLKNEDSWASSRKWIEFISSKLEVMGYKRAVVGTFGFFGGYILKKDDDGKRWKKLVGDKLFSEAISHNRKVAKRTGSPIIKI